MFHALPLMGLPDSRFGLSLRVRPSTIERTFLSGEALLAIGGSQPAETADPTTRRATMPTKAPKETKASKAPKAAKPSKEKGGNSEPASSGGPKPNALQKPLQPSKELAAVVGPEPLPRGEVVSKVWEYIKKHELQNPENRREILVDDTLEAVFGKKKVTMFEMNKYLAQHLTSPDAE
jgi:upstream activation factor subunit UAF30